jgi:hypothetical protein
MSGRRWWLAAGAGTALALALGAGALADTLGNKAPAGVPLAPALAPAVPGLQGSPAGPRAARPALVETLRSGAARQAQPPEKRLSGTIVPLAP